MADKVPVLTLVRAEDFMKIMDEANRILDAVWEMKVPSISFGLAGVSLVRTCIDATGGDMDWWVDLLRKGPDALVAVPLPEGVNTINKGPAGKQ